MSETMEQAKTRIENAPWDGPQDEPKHKDLPEPCAHTVETAKSSHDEVGIPHEELDRITDALIAALKTIYDPEIPVDIYELGLIYKIDINSDREVDVEMTLTAPGCPVAGDMPVWVENALSAVEGVSIARVKIVFTPPWDPSRMSDEARVALNMF
ncbi:FeS assembly SUF system protein [Rhodomicrobium vannielii ATCC 17100]|jgi:FeS assembly SUF system protein|uniref:FeS assembly SUF system protein n=1 Tax=Rhodomicrobium vannielii (strain ATCC 17100 / DSM 162 / LMG 4299 / NCIMB 10020 / ATH 3.1.1) TaxID=648757 RepID=E3HZ40_RHOVT|nr:SUF system Fe-S cluster assembly protein [Rhodomicrobium vannielii]ADP72087.1 FeS assembly SUF system protein [Rhodomicrobium vannielii ATCC 17100]